MDKGKFVLFLTGVTILFLTGFLNACHCGDNSINVLGEECDGKDFGGVTCLSLGFDAGKLSCYLPGSIEECTFDISGCYNFECGNGILELNEECDDGNNVSLDGCSSECKIEIQDPQCGNGVEEIGEECDLGILNGFLCWAGYEDSCTYCTSVCSEKTIYFGCGDNVTQSCEECDDGNNLSGDGCSSECTIEIPEPQCGNGVEEIGEECDDGNNVSLDGCSSECKIEIQDPQCGNGIIELNETCDDGALNGVLCSAGYEKFCEYCTNECKIQKIFGPYCGDGICSQNEDYNSCRIDCEKEDKDDDDDEFDNYYEETSQINNSCLGKACLPFDQLEKPSYEFFKEEIPQKNNNLFLILLIFATFFFLSFMALFFYFKLK